MSVLSLITAILFFAAAVIALSCGIILKIIDKKLIHLDTFTEVDKLLNDVAIQHDNYANFSLKKGLKVSDVDKDLMMLIYTTGVFDGLESAQRCNKKVVEKILSENFC